MRSLVLATLWVLSFIEIGVAIGWPEPIGQAVFTIWGLATFVVLVCLHEYWPDPGPEIGGRSITKVIVDEAADMDFIVGADFGLKGGVLFVWAVNEDGVWKELVWDDKAGVWNVI